MHEVACGAPPDSEEHNQERGEKENRRAAALNDEAEAEVETEVDAVAEVRNPLCTPLGVTTGAPKLPITKAAIARCLPLSHCAFETKDQLTQTEGAASRIIK